MLSNCKILIIDDEVLIADYLRDLIISEGAKFVETAYDYDSSKNLLSTFLPDIILLDINLNHTFTGLDLCKYKNENAHVIFITAQTEMESVKNALACKPVAYITKPVKKIDIIASVYLALQNNKQSILKIKSGAKEYIIKKDEILYIKCENIYLDIFTINKTFTVRSSLESFLEKLDSDIFMKVHRSYVVNKNYVTKITAKKIYLDKIEIPISRYFVSNL